MRGVQCASSAIDAAQQSLAGLEFADLDILVRLVRLRDIARPADDGRPSGLLKQAGLRAVATRHDVPLSPVSRRIRRSALPVRLPGCSPGTWDDELDVDAGLGAIAFMARLDVSRDIGLGIAPHSPAGLRSGWRGCRCRTTPRMRQCWRPCRPPSRRNAASCRAARKDSSGSAPRGCRPSTSSSQAIRRARGHHRADALVDPARMDGVAASRACAAAPMPCGR